MIQNGTSFQFAGGDKSGVTADVLVVPLVAKPQPPLELVTRVDAICDDAVSELLSVKAVGEQIGHVAHTTRSGVYRRIVVVSLGVAEKLTVQTLRLAAASTARWLVRERIPPGHFMDRRAGCDRRRTGNRRMGRWYGHRRLSLHRIQAAGHQSR